MITFTKNNKEASIEKLINDGLRSQGKAAYFGIDDNGTAHTVGVDWNSFRGYWIAEYNYAGRNVICRGTFEACLASAKAWLDRASTGSRISVSLSETKDAEIITQMSTDKTFSVEPACWKERNKQWHAVDWRREFFGDAIHDWTMFGIPPSTLTTASDVNDYKSKKEAYFNKRHDQCMKQCEAVSAAASKAIDEAMS